MITLRDVLERIIENQDTYIANRNVLNRYVNELDGPLCIVGHIVHGMGVELPRHDSNQNCMSFPHTNMARAFDPYAVTFLTWCQHLADNINGPKPRWGDVIYAAAISTMAEASIGERRIISPLIDKWHEVMDERGDGIYTLLRDMNTTLAAHET